MTRRSKRKIISAIIGLVAALLPILLFGGNLADWKFVVLVLAIDGAYFLGIYVGEE